MVLATFTRDDIRLCQITSKDTGHPEAVAIKMTEFVGAEKLPRDSIVLPHRLVTANESCVRRKAGRLQDAKLREIRDRVWRLRKDRAQPQSLLYSAEDVASMVDEDVADGERFRQGRGGSFSIVVTRWTAAWAERSYGGTERSKKIDEYPAPW